MPAEHGGEWWNWQTRTVQGSMAARLWEFKSPLAHKREQAKKFNL